MLVYACLGFHILSLPFRPPYKVTVVAHVLSVQAQTTNCVYLLDDGTAQFEARKWVDANNEEEGKREITYAPSTVMPLSALLTRGKGKSLCSCVGYPESVWAEAIHNSNTHH